MLGQISPVKAKDVSIDKQGRVVVDNDAFAATLKNRIKVGTAADNHGCGLGCAAPGKQSTVNPGQ